MMKILNLSARMLTLCMVVICVLGLVSCEKTNNNTETIIEKTTDYSISPVPEDLTQYEFIRVYSISEDGNAAGMVFGSYGELTNSENAKMGYFCTADEGRQQVTDAKLIAKHFPDFVKRIHKTDDYLITCYELFYLNNAELIRLEYVINHNSDNSESAMYLTNFKDGSKGAPVIVKCNGSCDMPSEKCFEHYYTNGTIACGCESDKCYMIVETVAVE